MEDSIIISNKNPKSNQLANTLKASNTSLKIKIFFKCFIYSFNGDSFAFDTNPNSILIHILDSINDTYNEFSSNLFGFNVVDLQTIVMNKSNEEI